MDGTPTPTVTPQLAGAQYPFPGAPAPTDQVALVPNPQDVQGILAQPQAAPAAPATTTVQVDPELQAAAVHHGRLAQTLHNIVDAVGGILGGNQTIHLTKDTDGNVTVTHDPSTTGEKWGRVISAALQGAAQGFGAGGGPQGAGNAARTGFQSGFNAPQEQQQQAEQEAQTVNDASEKRQLFNANKALLQQQIAMNTFNLDQMHSSLVDAMTKRANDSQAWIMANPSNKFLGVVTDPTELPEFEAKNADMLHNMTHGMYHTEMQMGPNGKPQIGVYAVDQAWMDQKNDKPVTYSVLAPGDKLTDPMKLVEKTIPAGAQTNGEISLAKEAETKRIGEYGLKLQKLQSDQETARTTAANTQSYRQSRLDIERQKLAQSGGAFGGGTAGGGTGEAALASVPANVANTVRAIGEGRQAPPNRATKEGLRLMNLVNQAYPDYDATQFPTYQNTRKAFTSGSIGTGLNFIQTARNHLSELEQNIPNNVDIPLIGSAINWAKNTATRATSPQLKTFESAREAVSSEVAKAYAGKAITQGEHDRMTSLINESDSPEALRAGITEFRRLLNGKLQSYRQQWNSGMPRGIVSPLSTLENLEADTTGGGGGGAPTPTAGGTPTPTPGRGAAATRPAGATMQVPGSDGRLHWSDGKTDLGVVAQ